MSCGERENAAEIGHTPEPWRWEFNANNKSVLLVGGKPQFDKTVMQFSRWGTQGAGPMFNSKIAGNLWNVMERLCDRPEWTAPFDGREHHANWCANVTHPDARRIVACVNACAGIPDEQLCGQEPGCLLAAMTEQEQEIMTITNQRDRLLAAIALAMPVMDAHAGPSRLADFHAAIASVKEKA